MRGRILWLIMGILAFTGGFFVAGRPARVSEYEHQVLWQAGWGKGPGQVAWVEGRDGNRYGPRSLALYPGGRIAVLDTFNRRIHLLGEQGQVGTVSLESDTYDDLAVAPDGTLCLVDNGKGEVVWLEQSGRVLARETLRSPGTDLYLIEGILAGEEVVYVQETGWTSTGFFRRVSFLRERGDERGILASLSLRVSGAKESEEGVIAEPVRGAALAPDGCLYLDTQTEDGFRRRVRVLSPRLQPWGEQEFHTGSYMGKGFLAGVDAQGCVYYLLSGEENRPRVCKFDARGRPVTALVLPDSEYVRLGRWVRISPQGDVYFLRAREEGLTLEAYRRKQRWVWRWRA